jgi:hypothetical protein
LEILSQSDWAWRLPAPGFLISPSAALRGMSRAGSVLITGVKQRLRRTFLNGTHPKGRFILFFGLKPRVWCDALRKVSD